MWFWPAQIWVLFGGRGGTKAWQLSQLPKFGGILTFDTANLFKNFQTCFLRMTLKFCIIYRFRRFHNWFFLYFFTDKYLFFSYVKILEGAVLRNLRILLKIMVPQCKLHLVLRSREKCLYFIISDNLKPDSDSCNWSCQNYKYCAEWKIKFSQFIKFTELCN